MKKNLPELNSRINGLMDELTEGNVVKLAWLLSQKAPQFKISQQKLNRIFIPDPRTKKIPSVPSDILMALALSTNVNANWLLTGRGEMLVSSLPDPSKNHSNEESIPDAKTFSSLEKGTVKMPNRKEGRDGASGQGKKNG